LAASDQTEACSPETIIVVNANDGSNLTAPGPVGRRPKSRLRSALEAFFTVVGIFAAYLAVDIFASYRMAPPSSHCTLAELAAKLPPPHHLAVIQTPAGTRMIWLGDTPWWDVRSGPPCYVFDDRCCLVEWCGETGEGWPGDQLASAARDAKSLTLPEALRRCEAPLKIEPPAEKK
jgi:hypothetical protein